MSVEARLIGLERSNNELIRIVNGLVVRVETSIAVGAEKEKAHEREREEQRKLLPAIQSLTETVARIEQRTSAVEREQAEIRDGHHHLVDEVTDHKERCASIPPLPFPVMDPSPPPPPPPGRAWYLQVMDHEQFRLIVYGVLAIILGGSLNTIATLADYGAPEPVRVEAGAPAPAAPPAPPSSIAPAPQPRRRGRDGRPTAPHGGRRAGAGRRGVRAGGATWGHSTRLPRVVVLQKVAAKRRVCTSRRPSWTR